VKRRFCSGYQCHLAKREAPFLLNWRSISLLTDRSENVPSECLIKLPEHRSTRTPTEMMYGQTRYALVQQKTGALSREPEGKGESFRRQSGKLGPEQRNLQCLVLKNKKESKRRRNSIQSRLYYLASSSKHSFFPSSVLSFM